MVTTLEHGVTAHDDTEGAIIQSLDIEEKVEESNLLGMVNGRTEIVRSWTHSKTNVFNVVGSGDLTLVVGENKDARLGEFISGGVANILSFKYSQKIPDPSQWSYSGNHYPHASAN